MTDSGRSVPHIEPSIDTSPIVAAAHPRSLGWIGTSALAMGGSNQSLFLLSALFIGQNSIPGQGSAAVPLLTLGLLLSFIAAPGWIELVLLFPNRVGGIASTCLEAFRPYSPVLAALAGVGYWWGWVPTCGLTAIISASAIHHWYLPLLPIRSIATALVLAFLAINLCGIKWVARAAIPIATASSTLAFLSAFLPVVSGQVDWRQATTFDLTTPFDGWFGSVTSMMAGLYLIGFAAPAFEAATCHVGETINPQRSVPRAVFASAVMAALYFVALPVIWLGALQPGTLGSDLALVLGPTFAPLFGSAARAAAIWFMVFTMFHGTLQPLAGAARVLSQLAEDGLVPRILGRRSSNDTPWVASITTAAFAILFLALGDPIWLIASANFTYLLGIALPSVAVWLLRRDRPDLVRSWRAPKGFILLGVGAAIGWGIAAILGFQQFGLPTVIVGLSFAYSGAALFLWRKIEDRRRSGLAGFARTLHLKLTGAMLLVLLLDSIGYLVAVDNIPLSDPALVAVLEDIFVAIAMLTVGVGLVIPGMISYSAVQVSQSADRLVTGTLAEFAQAMQSLGRGNLAGAHARVDYAPVVVNSRDEIGDMAASFNILQREIAESVIGLAAARDGLASARCELEKTNANLESNNDDLRVAIEAAVQANEAKTTFLAKMSHEFRTPLNAVLGFSEMIKSETMGPVGTPVYLKYANYVYESGKHLLAIMNDILDMSKVGSGSFLLQEGLVNLAELIEHNLPMVHHRAEANDLKLVTVCAPSTPMLWADYRRISQVLINLLSNSIKFTDKGGSISIEVQMREDGTLALVVTDTGIGMTPDHIQVALQPFGQVDNSHGRKYPGTGLGLPLAEGLMQQHGGHLQVTSTFGVGTRVSAVFPIERVRNGDIALERKPHHLQIAQ